MAALTLYLLTLQRGVSLPDSAVVMEAMQRPVVSAFACNHTLNNLLGWVVCHLVPFGSVAWRCNAVSAWYGAVLIALFYALIRRLEGSRMLAGLCAASLAVSHGVWWHSTVVENYVLSSVFLLVCAHLVLQPPRASAARKRRLFVLFAVAGLSLLNHLQNGVLLVACACALPDWHLRRSREWRWALSGALTGMAPYLIVASWEVATGRTGASWAAWLLGGGGFQTVMFRYHDWRGVLDVVRLSVWNYPGPFGVVALAGCVWGVCLVTRRGCTTADSPWAVRCRLLRLMAVTAAGTLAFFSGYETWDRFSFFLLAFVAAAVGGAALLATLEQRAARGMRVAVAVALVAGVVGAPIFYRVQVDRLVRDGVATWLTRPYVDVVGAYGGRYDLAGMLLDPVRRDGGTIEAFVRAALAALPAQAVWVDDGSTYFQAMFLQASEGLRPDVRLELLANAVVPDYGVEPHMLAMQLQWRHRDERWFLLTQTGPSAQMLTSLAPFGWQTRRFLVDEGRWLLEIVRE